METAQNQPKAFLTIPLDKESLYKEISQGWICSGKVREILPTIQVNYGVDLPAKWGTPVYAPADGVAVASYHTHYVGDRNREIVGYGKGLFVAIWHEDAQLYSTYCHLSYINNKLIPYLDPVRKGSDWEPCRALYVTVKKFKEKAQPVKTGDLIGHIGYTGLTIRHRCDEIPNNPPNVDPKIHRTWDPVGAHLHWEVNTRTLDGGREDQRFDPFGIYGEREKYANVFTEAQGLILRNPDGSPKFAR